MAIVLEPLKTRPRLSLTPLIDVVFLLLLFFMLATQFDKYQSIDLIFPSSNTEAKSTDLKPTYIHLLANEKISINGVPIVPGTSLNQIITSLDKTNSTGIVLKIAESVPTRRLTKIIDELKIHKISPVTVSQ
jgi:biopolymer transport protein ExbD